MEAVLFRRTKESSRKIRLQETFAAGEGQSPSGTAVIGRVFHDFFHDLFHAHITAHGLFLAALNHDLNITDLRLGITAPFAAKGTTLQENDGADARTVMNRIFLNIKDPSLDLSVIITHTFPPQKPWVVRLMMSS